MRVGQATRPHKGETANGDLALVVEDEGRVLCAVVDGLGHGPAAAEAARAAASFIAAHRELPLGEMLRRCDRAIAGTRGVAVTLVRIDVHAQTMEHAGVGNVELTSLADPPIRPVTFPGVVGARFRKTQVSSFDLHRGDVLVIFTDGISARLSLDRYRGISPQHAAEAILADHGRDHDDATCVVLAV